MIFSARSAAACSAVLALVMAGGEARAEPKDVLVIEWPSVSGCPGQRTVSALAARAIAGARDVDRVLARVELTPPPSSGEPWRVRIRTRTVRGAGERVLEARTCDELARATALLLALTALRTDERPVPTEADEIVPKADWIGAAPAFIEAPVRLAPNASPPQDERGEPAVFLATGGLAVDAGVLPYPAVEPTLRLEWGLGAWRLRAGFALAFAQERTERGLGGSFNLLSANVDLCRSTVLRALRPHACVGAELDQITATGIGDQRFESRRTTGLAFGGLGVEWRVAEKVRLGIDLRMGPSLRRPSFTTELASGERRQLHEASSLRGQALATIGFEL